MIFKIIKKFKKFFSHAEDSQGACCMPRTFSPFLLPRFLLQQETEAERRAVATRVMQIRSNRAVFEPSSQGLCCPLRVTYCPASLLRAGGKMELGGKSFSLPKKQNKKQKNLGQWHPGIPERVGRVLLRADSSKTLSQVRQWCWGLGARGRGGCAGSECCELRWPSGSFRLNCRAGRWCSTACSRLLWVPGRGPGHPGRKQVLGSGLGQPVC